MLLVVICAVSWFSVIKSYKTGKSEYNALMQEADTLLEKKIYAEAEEKYQRALDYMPNDKDAQLGLANIYYLTEEYEKAVTILEKMQKSEPKNKEIAIFMAKCLSSGGKYKKSVEILSQVEQTSEIVTMINDIKSRYSLTYISITNAKDWAVSSVNSDYCAVQDSGKYSVINSMGKRIVSGDLSYVGPVSEDGETYPAIHENTWCYVDSEGNRKLVPNKEYSFLGPFCNGYAVAKLGEYFGYIDKDFNEYHFEYEKAYNFSEGEAAVLKDGRIMLINTDFSIKAQTDYSGIVSDEYGYTNHFGYSVCIKNEKYHLCTSNGAKVGEVSADYMLLPNESGGLVPFALDGKYGYLSTLEGKVVIEPTYEDAKASSNGLCAVKVGDKWGYFDKNGTKIVDFVFDYASFVSKDGTAIIKNEAGFALLSFYYLKK